MEANLQSEVEALRNRVRELERELAAKKEPSTTEINGQNGWSFRENEMPHASQSVENAVQEQFQALVESSPLPIVVLTRNGDVTLWNPAAERLFGWKAEEVLGGPLPFIPEEKRAEHRVMRERDLSGEGVKDVEVRRVRKDGSYVDIRVSTALLRDKNNSVTGIVSLYVDLTEQKKAAREREEARTRMEQQWRLFDTALSHTPDSIYILDRQGRFVYANKTLLQLWQKSLEEVRGRTMSELGYPSELVRKVLRQFRTVIKSREPIRDEASVSYPAQGPRQYEYILVPIFKESGEVEAIAGSTRDITERKIAQEVLRQQAEELVRINEDLEHFAYAAAHDLQEPLRMVSIFTQLLGKRYGGQLDEQADAYIRHAVEGAKRMEMLVRDLLAYTRLAVAEKEACENVDAEKVLAKTLCSLAAAVDESGAVISHAPLPSVSVQEVHLQQLFQNLIGNAIKYRSKDTPRIHISAAEHDGMWRFAIQDNGIGIEDQYKEQIFGLFKRLHSNTEYEGTGIGLAICQKIVQRYKGCIWIKSHPGEGSTFFFTVPR